MEMYCSTSLLNAAVKHNNLKPAPNDVIIHFMNKYLKPYVAVADMITGMFGAQCEAVIHDLTNPEYSVIYVSNGTVTNRKIGQSFDHLVRNVLLNRKFADDQLVNYSFDTIDGKKINSSSLLIRDENDIVVGMLCVNYNVTQFENIYADISAFLQFSNDIPKEENYDEEDVSEDIMTVINRIIQNTISQNTEPLTRKKSMEIVSFLNDKGIFLVTGWLCRLCAGSRGK